MIEIEARLKRCNEVASAGRSMIQDYPETDLFKERMRESLQREVKNSRTIKIPKQEMSTLLESKTRWSTSLRARR